EKTQTTHATCQPARAKGRSARQPPLRPRKPPIRNVRLTPYYCFTAAQAPRRPGGSEARSLRGRNDDLRRVAPLEAALVTWRQAGRKAEQSTQPPVAARRLSFPRSRRPARLAHELQPVDHNPLLRALAHVVNRERGDGACGHRFHLHARLPFAADDRVDLDRAGARVEIERDVDGVEADRMRQRNERR